MPKLTLYIGSIVHSISLNELQQLPSAALCVDSKGVIQWLETGSSTKKINLDEVIALHPCETPYEVVVIPDGSFLCPGMIDTHTHAPQYPNNGLGQEYQLLEWLEKLTFPQESRFSDLAYARSIYEKVVHRNLSAGTTTCCYYGSLHSEGTAVLATICAEQGQRAFVGKCNMDRLCPDTYIEPSSFVSLSSTETFISHFSTLPSIVQPILTPRFALSCTPELLSGLGKLAKDRNLLVQTHLSENPTEIAKAKELFPDCSTYAGVYEKFGLLNEGTILAHCVHLGDEDRQVIKRNGAGVSHCPASNLNLNSGAARITDLLDMNIKVGLGTDCSGGYSIGLLSAIRNASNVSKTLSFLSLSPRHLSIPELFHMATLGGASLCKLDQTVGNFLKGKKFDALLVSPSSPGMFTEDGESLERIFEKWLFTGDDRDVVGVWVDGKKVVG